MGSLEAGIRTRMLCGRTALFLLGPQRLLIEKSGALRLLTMVMDPFVTDTARRRDLRESYLHHWAPRIGCSSANPLTPDRVADLGGGGTIHDAWVDFEKTA